ICTDSNCNAHLCWNDICPVCFHDYGTHNGRPARAFDVDGLDCERRCSWRSDSNLCFPGTCELVGSCSCSSGFSGHHCRQITARPTYLHWIGYLHGSAGGTAEIDDDNLYTWTNKIPSHLEFQWQFKYDKPNPTYHAYIRDFKVGPVQSSVSWRLLRGGSTVTSDSRSCDESLSRDAPPLAPVQCDREISVSFTPVHLDELKVDISTKLGGFMSVYNYDSRSQSNVYYNDGPSQTISAKFGFDYTTPTNAGSLSDMLDLGEFFTKQQRITAGWSGWSDTGSGVGQYRVDVYQLQRAGEELTETFPPIHELVVDTSQSSVQFDMGVNTPGVFSVVLAVEDASGGVETGNMQLCRRFFIYDSLSDITVDVDEDIGGLGSIYASSALAGTDYQWQTNLADPITVRYQDHFIQHTHQNGRFLAHIRAFSGLHNSATYDDVSTGGRSRQSIDNEQGVVRFQVASGVDNQGGETLSPTGWTDVDDLHSGVQSVMVSRDDGNTVKVWIKAFDIVGNEKTDGVTVHIDSSPPVITDLWLEKDGEPDLAVHHLQELWEMRVEFQAYDVHSGLHTISWELLDMDDHSIVHGTGNLAVRTESNQDICTAGECVCVPMSPCYMTGYEIVPDASKMAIPTGGHNHDYHLVVTVTNRARLVTTQTLQITIDISPPEPGHVMDSLPGQVGMDFQNDENVHCYWSGFFDHESGVKFYQVYFDTRCGTSDDFGVPEPQMVTRKTPYETLASYTAPVPGTYYCTVVAYNRALDPSVPVCSDGVVYDNTKPTVTNIAIENIHVHPGAVKDSSGDVWMVDDMLRKTPVENPSSTCRSVARQVEDPHIFPDRELEFITQNKTGFTYRDWQEMYESCESVGPLAQHYFLTGDKHLRVYWNGSDDESSIQDYLLGLSSTESSVIDPDIMPLTPTNGHTFSNTRHSGLGEGIEFYLGITAINKAGLRRTKVVGPIIVDVTPPTFSGEVSVSVEDSFLVARWPGDGFSDDEDGDALNMAFAIGHLPGGEDVMTYSSLNNTERCHTAEITCTAVATTELQWGLHGNHTYYVSIKATDAAGLSVVEVSPPYVHNVEPPARGVVEDVNPDVLQDGWLQPAVRVRAQVCTRQESIPIVILDAEDADFQVNNTVLVVRWSGFSHAHLDVSYDVGVGSAPGDDDIVPFVSLGVDVTTTRIDVDLEFLKVVKAKTDVGEVTASSDGITVLPQGLLEGSSVNDGLPCEHTSTTTVAAYWSISDQSRPFVTNINWKIEQEITNQDGDSTWVIVRDFVDLGMAESGVETGLYLVPGGHYISVVEFCHQAACFHPVYSPGFRVVPEPPFVGDLDVTITSPEEGVARLYVTFEKFLDPHLNSDAVMDFYEWAITEDSKNGQLLTDWTTVVPTTSTSRTVSFIVPSVRLEVTKCLQLAVRGHTRTGMTSLVAREILECETTAENPGYSRPIVIDAIGNVTIDKNAAWNQPDVEYTSSTVSISAVWPTLRHHQYEWALIDDTNGESLETMSGKHLSIFYPCKHETAIACGYTDKEYQTVEGVSLEHGKRYIMCVHANETSRQFETWTDTYPEVAACSSGVTVDTSPPVPGEVWIGTSRQSGYQKDYEIVSPECGELRILQYNSGRHDSTSMIFGRHITAVEAEVKYKFRLRGGSVRHTSTSEMYIEWEHYVDVEEHGFALHHSGIQHYEYALGTSSGGTDIQTWTDVGYTDHVLLHGLILQDGWSYYATVKAYDFVGLSAVAVSQRVTIDTTPPLKEDVNIDSGVSFYEWAVGSRPGHADIAPFSRTVDTMASTDPNSPLSLHEGHTYYVSVKAYNMVGLVAMATSSAVAVETTPPTMGNVYDGRRKDVASDVDYQPGVTSIHAHWGGFHDPHTSIISYSWSVGTCPKCSNILQPQNVGIVTEASVDGLTLFPGKTYYVTVTACNAADLCTSVTSDGVIPDTSPPVSGRVMDGALGSDVNYQATSNTLAAHWYGFTDPHSGLSHYEWRAGTTKGGEDILSVRKLHLTDVAIATNVSLPENTAVYVTVTAYNRVGLAVETSSNGFIVDTSAPTVTSPARVNQTHGSGVEGTQIWRSAVRVTWGFGDPESLIVEQHLSLHNHHGAEVANVKVTGSEQTYTFTGLALDDGNEYIAMVTGCNGASLCTQQSTAPILIDSSPPVMGMFAVHTAHAARLTRHRDGWMTWTNQGSPQLNLSWIGFSDYHCGIESIAVTNGEPTVLEGNLLLPGNCTPDDEGCVHGGIVPLSRELSLYSTIYISLWAVNGVGLRSRTAHSAFTVVPSGGSTSGSLQLVRRCDAHSCLGHCTCAPVGQTCAVPIENPCSHLNASDSVYSTIEVYDRTEYRQWTESDPESDADYTYSTCALAASWKEVTVGSSRPYRYEWSAGIQGESVGAGLFDLIHDDVWRDVSMETHAILTMPSGESLEAGVTYTFYVRVWYDDHTYSVFQSDGITPDYTPPAVSSSRKIKDLLSPEESHDVDYMAQTTSLSTSYSSVFFDSVTSGDSSHMHRFELALGTYPGGEDVQKFAENHVIGLTTNYTFSGLSLSPTKTYYSTVRAFNLAGLHITYHSDGVMVDIVSPKAGVVHDGTGVHDADYQSSTTELSAFWHGFTDLESGVRRYLWCVGRTAGPSECSVKNWMDNGASERERYFIKVVAEDAAGNRSPAAVSDGIVIDSTPPVPEADLVYGDNLLLNPSFELTTGSADIERQEYRVSFSVNHDTLSDVPTLNQEGIVTAPGIASAFKLRNRPASSNDREIAIKEDQSAWDTWQRQTFFFTAVDNSSVITIGSVGRKAGISVDNVKVQAMTYRGSRYNSTARYYGDVEVSCQLLSDWSSVVAKWSMVDPESPIVDYSWAIGKVRGGTQLQGFTSVGQTRSARRSDLPLQHGSYIHVTVVATNAAGLRSVMYSDPAVVDLTPPVIGSVLDGADNTSLDVDYQMGDVISGSWPDVMDDESGIESCEWALGYRRGIADLTEFMPAEGQKRSASLDTLGILRHGQKVYFIVRCHNKAGQSSTASSDGVTVVRDPPRVDHASLEILSEPVTHFRPRNHEQYRPDEIEISWDGFEDESGISHYQYILEGTDLSTQWIDIPWKTQNTAKLTGLQFLPGEMYTLSLRAVNFAGLSSQSISREVVIVESAPSIRGEIAITWPSSDTFNLNWEGSFEPFNPSLFYEVSVGLTEGGGGLFYEVSVGLTEGGGGAFYWVETTENLVMVFFSNPVGLFYEVSAGLTEGGGGLFYEVSVGLTEGGGGVFYWVETTETHLSVSGIDHDKEYFVSINAINGAGMYTTVKTVVSYGGSR
ncbi:hypothetical protein Bbelb_155420, partial [Branchiostoma belcheri]